MGCMGGRRQFAFNYTSVMGVTTVDNYPSVQGGVKEDCRYDKKKQMMFKIDGFKAWERITNSDLETLACQGPVSVSLRINDCVKDYVSGIIFDGPGSSCGCSSVPSANHAAVIVGFGVDRFASVCKAYWLLKNQWGSEWGEGGFFRLCKEDDDLPLGTCNVRAEPMIAYKY